MDHDRFEYLPKVVRSRKATQKVSPIPPEDRQQLQRVPVRVSPAAVGWLVYVIVGTIEFHAPTGPRPRKLAPSTTSVAAGAVAGIINPQKVVGAVSSFFGMWSAPRTHTAATATANRNETDAGTADLRSIVSANASVSSAAAAAASGPLDRDLLRRQEEEQAAVRRAQEQPHVVPEVEAIPVFGNLCICVCHAHNRSIDEGYRQVLREIDEMVQRAHDRAAATAATALRSGFHSLAQPLLGSPNRSAASLTGSESVNTISSPEPIGTDVVPLLQLAGLRGAGGGSGGAPSQLASLSSLGMGSTVQQQLLLQPPYTLLPGEVGFELIVRLLSRETQWHDRRERLMAEFTFPVIRTANELTVIDLNAVSPVSSPTESTPKAATAAAAGMHTSLTSSLLFVNDPAQVQDVINYISDSFYKTLVLDTFADFFSGELVFDIRVAERRSFAPPRILY